MAMHSDLVKCTKLARVGHLASRAEDRQHTIVNISRDNWDYCWGQVRLIGPI
jgi:hypothetical protein